MLVKDLIEKLSKCDPNKKVCRYEGYMTEAGTWITYEEDIDTFQEYDSYILLE